MIGSVVSVILDVGALAAVVLDQLVRVRDRAELVADGLVDEHWNLGGVVPPHGVLLQNGDLKEKGEFSHTSCDRAKYVPCPGRCTTQWHRESNPRCSGTRKSW